MALGAFVAGFCSDAPGSAEVVRLTVARFPQAVALVAVAVLVALALAVLVLVVAL